MPDMSGVELVQWIPITRPDLPVILCSGNLPQVSDSLADIGIHHFLQKPFDFHDLAKAIRKILDDPDRSCNGSGQPDSASES